MRELVLTLVLAGCAHPMPPQKFAPVDAEPPNDEGATLAASAPALEAAVRGYVETQRPKAIAVGVVYRDRLIWSHATSSIDQVFCIGSITKVFAGLALLLLRDQGRISLDDPVDRWLPEFGGVIYPSSDSPRVTLRHLVTHSSGLVRSGPLATSSKPVLTESDLLASLAGQTLEFVPGTRWSYSHQGLALVGPILTRITKRPFQEWMREALFAPLGLDSATWDSRTIPEARRAPTRPPTHELGAMATMGGLSLSLRDLARFASFELDAWPPRSTPEHGPVRRATVRESQLIAGPTASGPGFGISWNVSWDSQLGHVVLHDGALYDHSAIIDLLPGRGIGVVALQASSAPEKNDFLALDDLAIALLRVLVPPASGDETALAQPAAVGLGYVQELLERPDQGRIKEVFAASYLRAMPPGHLSTLFRDLHRLVGECHDVASFSQTTPTDAEIRLRCAQKNLEVVLGVSATPPHPIQALRLRPVD